MGRRGELRKDQAKEPFGTLGWVGSVVIDRTPTLLHRMRDAGWAVHILVRPRVSDGITMRKLLLGRAYSVLDTRQSGPERPMSPIDVSQLHFESYFYHSRNNHS